MFYPLSPYPLQYSLITYSSYINSIYRYSGGGVDSTFFGSSGGIGGPNPPLLGRCIAIHVCATRVKVFVHMSL